MAVDGPSYVLAPWTDLFTAPVAYDQGVDPQQATPTGFVAPVAWAYNQFPNEAPWLWERAWYRSKSSSTTTATHSVLATLQAVRITGVAQAPTVIVAGARIDAGVAQGEVQVIGAASPVPGRVAAASGMVRVLSGKALLGTVGTADPGSGTVALTGMVDGFTATSLPVTHDPLIVITGSALADITVGGQASGQVRLTGAAEGTRARYATFGTPTVRLTGTAKATLEPPLTAPVAPVVITGQAVASQVRYVAATGPVVITTTKPKVSTGPSVSASGTVVLRAAQGEVVQADPQLIAITSTATATQIHSAKATGSKVRILPVSVFARTAGEPVATGTIRLSARIWESWEAAVTPGVIEILRGQAKAVAQTALRVSGDVFLTGSATADRLVMVEGTGEVILGGVADGETLPSVASMLAPVVITGTADAHTEPGIRADGTVVLTGAVEPPEHIHAGESQATIDLDAEGDGEVPPPLVVESFGWATLDISSKGEGAITESAWGVSNAWIILRGTGSAARTVEADQAPTAWMRLRAYGTALPLRFIREHVAPHRADTWLIHAEVLPVAHIEHGALESAISRSVSTTRTTVRVDEPAEMRIT